ncbi:MAG TPA: hypothetical protein VMX12_00855, partial [Acidimicrobiia bacterium]|nr:hypothetical protein [Acidimicrobiia bacterium]
NAAAVAVLVVVQSQALTSLWCVWAAVVSFLVLLQLRDWRREERRGANDPIGSSRAPSRVSR